MARVPLLLCLVVAILVAHAAVVSEARSQDALAVEGRKLREITGNTAVAAGSGTASARGEGGALARQSAPAPRQTLEQRIRAKMWALGETTSFAKSAVQLRLNALRHRLTGHS
jgi:hypothetical protein